MAGSNERRVSADGVELTVSADVADATRARIEEGARSRAADPPPLALRRTESLAAELDGLAAAIDELRRRMDRYGEVTTKRGGVIGQLEVFLKSAARKLVQRHIDQEKEVHAALIAVLDRLTAAARAEHALLDENATVLTEDAERRERRERGD